MHIPEATDENAALLRKILGVLTDDLERLVHLTRKYPQECTYGDNDEYRVVFAKREDIETYISGLSKSLDIHEKDLRSGWRLGKRRKLTLWERIKQC